MKILAIESSGNVASVAVLEDEIVIGEFTINHTLKHSKTLMPMIEHVFEMLSFDIQEIELVAISEGPGSFTGLRIGSATAKAIGQSLKIPVMDINTLEAVAENIPFTDGIIHVIQYARATEMYYQSFEQQKNTKRTTITVEDFLKKIIEEKEKPQYIVGDAVKKFEQQFDGVTQENIYYEKKEYFPVAKNIGRVARRRYDSSIEYAYEDSKPFYQKKSQAEREYDEKHK